MQLLYIDFSFSSSHSLFFFYLFLFILVAFALNRTRGTHDPRDEFLQMHPDKQRKESSSGFETGQIKN